MPAPGRLIHVPSPAPRHFRPLGLAIAVIIDATIIRVVVLPALMTMLGRANWRPPRPFVAHTHLTSAAAWWAEMEAVFREAFEGVGYAGTAAELAYLAGRYYADGSRWGLFEDTMPVLRRLRGDGWRHVVLSNNIPELEANLRLLGLGEVVDVVVCSAVIGYEKPHPEAYRCALRAAGHPRTRWMVSDNFQADVVGAERAGIPAILVRSDHPRAPRRAGDLVEAASLIAARPTG